MAILGGSEDNMDHSEFTRPVALKVILMYPVVVHSVSCTVRLGEIPHSCTVCSRGQRVPDAPIYLYPFAHLVVRA